MIDDILECVLFHIKDRYGAYYTSKHMIDIHINDKYNSHLCYICFYDKLVQVTSSYGTCFNGEPIEYSNPNMLENIDKDMDMCYRQYKEQFSVYKDQVNFHANKETY